MNELDYSCDGVTTLGTLWNSEAAWVTTSDSSVPEPDLSPLSSIACICVVHQTVSKPPNVRARLLRCSMGVGACHTNLATRLQCFGVTQGKEKRVYRNVPWPPYMFCAMCAAQHHAWTFRIAGTKFKEFYFLNVWKYLMLPITEKLKCRVERREEMNSNRTVSYYAGLRNTRTPVNINLWPANSLKILNSHRKSFPWTWI